MVRHFIESLGIWVTPEEAAGYGIGPTILTVPGLIAVYNFRRGSVTLTPWWFKEYEGGAAAGAAAAHAFGLLGADGRKIRSLPKVLEPYFEQLKKNQFKTQRSLSYDFWYGVEAAAAAGAAAKPSTAGAAAKPSTAGAAVDPVLDFWGGP